MKVLHLIGGGDVGGAKIAVLSLVKELGRHIDVKIVSFRPGIFTDEAREMGIDIEIVKTGNIISDMKKVLKIIRDGNFELIHSHGAKANLISAILKHKTKLPAVTTVHSDYRLDYLQSVPKMLSFGIINTIALRFVDYYIGVSRNFKEMLIKRKFNPNKIFTVYNGIDFDAPLPEYSRQAFAEKYRLKLAKEDVVVGILARLDPVKGINIFIDAAKEVLDKYPSVKFIVGGDGPERSNLERKAAELGITDNVLFPGWINDGFEFMSSIDINVLTSLSESFPYVILEGTRFRKATVSSDVGGVSDLIDSGENGYLFKVGDHKELAAHLLKLVNNAELRKSMGDKIYKKASTQFSLNNMCKTQLDIYEKIQEAAGTVSQPYDIIVSGWYGVGNIGDDAILRAIINDLRHLKSDAKILVLSKNPIETMKSYNVDSIYRYNIIKTIKAMKNARLFLNGGGTLIQDMTSTRSLMYYLWTIWLASKLGMRVMVYANGIGPISRTINRKLTKAVLNKVDVITLREPSSRTELENLGINHPDIQITADPALGIVPADNASVDAIFKKEGIEEKGPFVGFSVREWNGRGKYIEIIARLADYVIDKYGATPVFIPMQHPGDVIVMEDILKKMKGKAYIIRGKYGSTGGESTLAIIKRMNILVGMRLHALIFAASTGVPIIGLPYELKVNSFLSYIGQSGNVCSCNLQEMEYDKLRYMVDDIWNNRDAISSSLLKVTAAHRQKSVKNAQIAIDILNRCSRGDNK